MIPRAVPTLFDPSHDPGMLHEYHLANFTRAAYPPPATAHLSSADGVWYNATACGFDGHGSPDRVPRLPRPSLGVRVSRGFFGPDLKPA
jgi:hypothetical protein